MTIEVKIISAGVQAILKGPEVMDFLEAKAIDIAAECGPGYEVTVGTRGTNRGRVFVQPATNEAAKDNAENDTLLRALGGGG